jgi:hypothetical protein
MAILATNNGTTRPLIPADLYVARCYSMIHIGTVEEIIEGSKKMLNKVRIGFELPTFKSVFNEEKGEQPYVISKEFTLSLNEKATLRKFLDSWRGKSFTEEEAKSFDITKLLGVPCTLNIIKKTSKNGTNEFNEISTITKVMNGVTCPEAINPIQKLEYDNFDHILFDSLPTFIKDKIVSSVEYKKMIGEIEKENQTAEAKDKTDLPF